jgi:hypothetical protein
VREWPLPPDDPAYERVTNPERFLPLHAAADVLVARLEARYQVERRDGGPAADEGVVRQVELVPAAGAPLTVRWDDFPAVSVRYGTLCDETYPPCGCDACEAIEQPEDLAQDLEERVDALVAGRFSERIVTYEHEIVLEYTFQWEGGGCARGGNRIPEGHPLLDGPQTIEWPPWPPRSPPHGCT